MTVPDLEMRGAVLIARTTGSKLGESCMSASMCELGNWPKYSLFFLTINQRT